MENFKPTDEQLIDYTLDELESDERAKVQAYLRAHPEVQQELEDGSLLENVFQKMDLPEPSEQTLAKVLQNAAREVQVKKSFWEAFRLPAMPKLVTATFSIALLAGATFALTRIMIPSSPITPGHQIASQDATTNGSHLATAGNNDSINKIETDEPFTLTDWAHRETNRAIDFYKAEDYKSANKHFAKVINKVPNFEGRKKLYRYWVKSLQKAGEYQLAAEKKAILDQLNAEDS